MGLGAGAQLWNIVKPVQVYKRFGAGNWFDPTAYAQPASGTFAPRGTRNRIYNPGFQSWNLALVKTFHVIPNHEDQQVLFRAQAFNFTNHPNWDNVGTTPTASTFAQVTTKGQTYASDRNWQFRLRY